MSREAPPPGEEAAPEGAGGGEAGGEDGCYLALCARPVHFEKANAVNCVFFDEANKQVGAAPGPGCAGLASGGRCLLGAGGAGVRGRGSGRQALAVPRGCVGSARPIPSHPSGPEPSCCGPEQAAGLLHCGSIRYRVCGSFFFPYEALAQLPM